VLDMQGKPGRRYRVIDDFYEGLSYWLTELAYDRQSPLRVHSLDAPLALPRNPVPEPDLTIAQRYALHLQGGMMGGGAMAGTGGMMGMGGMSGDGASWAINGMSMTGDGQTGMSPLLTLHLGRSYILTLHNDTAWWHPMHLHGHSFRLLSRNGAPVPYRQWADTVLIPPKEAADIAFVADNPGDWMLHCHVTDHQVSGMMTIIRIA
jgi:FtsP/CotA-like multicopper oxidase with cupredoxin domain